MSISLETIIDIAERAVYPGEWSERSKQIVRASTPVESSQADRLLKRWERLITQPSQRDYRDFEHRLESLGIDRASATEKIGTRCQFTHQTLPVWAKQLQAILNRAVYPLPSDLQGFLPDLSDGKSLLFPEALHPFLQYYLKMTQDKASSWLDLITTETWSSLLQHLLHRLSALAARAIAADVKQKSVLGRLRGKTPEDRYQYYITQVVGRVDGLIRLLQRYPVLARLLVTVTEQAVSTTGLWIQRLKNDRRAISDAFTNRTPVGKVTEVEPGLSDPHNGGQTVWRIQFESGLQLAYKPRSLAPDLAYLQFLTWLNQQQPTLKLKAAPVLAGSSYGWVEWLETSECTSKEEVASYYRRQGAHIALFYFLCGSDFHEENFVAAGSFPVPIDLEALGSWALTQTSPEIDTPEIKQQPYFWRIYDSVFSTAMLPRWVTHPAANVEALMMSALSERGSKAAWPLPLPVWHNLGTDEISLTFERYAPEFASALPRYKGQAVPVAAHINDVLEGFAQTYQVVLAHQASLLSESSPLKNFEDLPTRALIRSTASYTELLFFTTAPDNLTSGAAYDVALERVCGLPIADEQRDKNLTYSQVEKQALWSRDIPYFVGSTSDCYLYAKSGERFGPINVFSGYENIRKRVQMASQIDLHWQQELLRTSLAMMRSPRGTIPKPAAAAPQTSLSLDAAIAKRFYSHIIDITQHIDSQVLHHTSGIGWLTLALYSRSGIPQLEHAAPWVSSGNMGIAIFLANLAAYTKNSHWQSLIHQAIETTTTLIEQEKLQIPLVQSGLYYGIAGVLYGLQTCATKLNNKDYLHQAYHLATSIPIETWREVSDPDIINGASASLLALLHLYDEISDKALLERAIAIGIGIQEHQEQTGVNTGGFRVPLASRPLLGMGHGAAGIVYALSKLYAITSDSTLKRAIQQGLAYERSCFDRDYQDWPDLWHDPSEHRFMAGFCGGAAGLGLARLKMLPYYKDDRMLDEIETACQATLRYAGDGAAGHHLCCGEASRIIFLCQAAQQLQRDDLFEAAVLVAEQMLTFYEKRGYWRLGDLNVRSIVPGLTDGIAGIGLALLTVLDCKNTSSFLSLS